jgi:hypothetical protein
MVEDEDLFLGNYTGKGSEIYHLVDDSKKKHTVKYKVLLEVNRLFDDCYKIRSTYKFARDGKIFDRKYKKGQVDGKYNYVVSSAGDGHWTCLNVFDDSSDSKQNTLIEHFTTGEGKHLTHTYNSNSITAPVYFGNSVKGNLLQVLGSFTFKKDL